MNEEVIRKFSLEGKRVLITGASKGIGRACALWCARAGADLVITARSEDLLRSLADEISSETGKRVVPIRCDVTSESDVVRTIESAWEELGGVDVLVNNAGISLPSPAEEIRTEDWKKVLDVNLNGVFYFAREWGRRAIRDGIRGVLINIASILGMFATKWTAHYSATKGGVIVLTKVLALEWARHGIRVNCIAPGWVETEMTRGIRENEELYKKYLKNVPMRRWAKPEEIATAVIFLASEASSYMTGHTLVIDGGVTII